MICFARMRLLAKVGRAFAADRTGGPAMEFAIVGLYFFLVLFFVIQGGIYYLRETILDYATEAAARAVMINDNPGYSVAAPTSAAAFLNLVASNGFGLLGPANYNASTTAPMQVALQMVPEAKTIFGNASYGFRSVTPWTFNGTTPPYQFKYAGSCGVNYFTNYAINGTGQTGSGVSSISSCSLPAGDTTDTVCPNSLTNMNGNNLIINGFADGGTPTVSYPNAVVVQYNYTGGTFTCNANQFVLLQVQYTDSTLVPLISNFFGPIVSTVAFKIEPPPT